MEQTSVGTDVVEVLENTRPSIAIANPLGMSEADYLTWAGTRPHKRSTPIYVETASLHRGRKSNPIVADSTMCAQISGSDGGYATYSPKSLIRDKYIDMVVTATSALTLSTGSPTGNLSVSALSQALPIGFLLKFGDSNWVSLTQAAAKNATTLHLRVLYPDIYGSLVISIGNHATPLNGYFYQGGTPGSELDNYALIGMASPIVRSGNWDAMKYSCDGVAISSAAAVARNLLISNFPGHGFYSTFHVDPRARVDVGELPYDNPEILFEGINQVKNCLAGFTLNAADSRNAGTLIARGCRDYGIRLNGSAIQGGAYHGYASKIGVWISQPAFPQHVRGEDSDYGVILDAQSPTSSGQSQIGGLRTLSNKYLGVRVLGAEIHCGSMEIVHSSNLTNNSDPYPTGWGLNLGSFVEGFSCPSLYIDNSGGTANGCRFGQFTVNTMKTIHMQGRLKGGGGAVGLQLGVGLVGSVLNLNIDNYTRALDFGSGQGPFQGNDWTFRGAASSAIKWPDGSDGRFDAPNYPSGMDTDNNIKFLVY